MRKKFNVVAAGRAYTDVIAHAAFEFLQNYQIPLNGQRECTVSELKHIQMALPSPQMVAGGSSANSTAIISALGGNAGFFGKVHFDGAGKNFLSDLKARNITLCCEPSSKMSEISAICLVLLTHDQRSFAYNIGCGDYFSKEDFNQFDFFSTDFFLIEAHLLTSQIAKPALIAALSSAENKCKIVINLQGIMNWDGFSDAIHLIISKASIIIGNQDEQAALMHAMHLLALSPQPSQLILTTKGIAGSEISQAGSVLVQAPSQKPIQFVSSIGAGDAFTAGFLLAQSRGMGIQESMHYATHAATAILEEEGARPVSINIRSNLK